MSVIIGVDGEGEDVYRCLRCEGAIRHGDACLDGGVHVRELVCRLCGCSEARSRRAVCEDRSCRRCGLPKRRAKRERCLDPRGHEHESPAHDLHPIAVGHIYTYLCAVDEFGVKAADVFDPRGLSHDACMRTLLSLPKKALKFGYMFSYDVTMQVAAMPPLDRYRLVRPATREAKRCLTCKARTDYTNVVCHDCGADNLQKYNRPVVWAGRKYDFFNGSFTVSEGSRVCKVWDSFRFFGGPFVEALRDWSVGTDVDGPPTRKGEPAQTHALAPGVCLPEDLVLMQGMKDKRGHFAEEDAASIHRYCQNECHYLAVMMRSVVDAHEGAGMILRNYYGAGSTASALLNANDVGDYKGPPIAELPWMLAHAIASAFFGGRFENATIGFIEQLCEGFDISSAYPFALSALPCLQCGSWAYDDKLTKTAIEESTAAGKLTVAAFRVRRMLPRDQHALAWAPLPCRDQKGSIAYGVNFSGWAWAPELLAALDGWPDIVVLKGGGWTYTPGCGPGCVSECKSKGRPFGFLPDSYRTRVSWGKEGRGKSLKLGINACVTGDTVVLTEEGPMRIVDLVGSTIRIVAADGKLREACRIFEVGMREVYRLRTAGGLELRLTADHLVETWNRGDVRAWELTPEDQISTAFGADTLASFERAGEAIVFDLTEPETSHFVANGIVIHNSYGKTAQAIGEDPPFQSWVWAGMTTSTCRGQLLRAISSAKNMWNVLSVATDGIYATELLPLGPAPWDTGTSDLAKPLGGWEHKNVEEGLFIVKPGLYYRLDVDSPAEVKARGIGRRELYGNRKRIEAGFLEWHRKEPCGCLSCEERRAGGKATGQHHVEVTGRRFYGAKHSISVHSNCACGGHWPGLSDLPCPRCAKEAVAENRSAEPQGTGAARSEEKEKTMKVTMTAKEDGTEAYGTWGPRTARIAFDPYPKRNRDDLSRAGRSVRLHVRDLGGITSKPYDVGTHLTTPEGQESRELREFELEQPDWNG